MILRLKIIFFAICISFNSLASEIYIPTREDISNGDVEIVVGEDKTVYEYRVNGRLLMIKIVPKIGFTYYMVPADGSAHFISLDHGQSLYPQWVLFEW